MKLQAFSPWMFVMQNEQLKVNLIRTNNKLPMFYSSLFAKLKAFCHDSINIETKLH